MTTLPSRITAFRDGRQCSTRSSLNFEICGAVARCRFEIFLVSANIPADWVVLGYSWAAIGTPWSADGSEWRPPLSQRHSASTRSIHMEPQPMLIVLRSHWHRTGVLVVERRPPIALAQARVHPLTST